MVDDSVSPFFDQEQFVLEHLQVAASEVLSASVMASMSLHALRDVVGDSLLFQLRAYVQAEHLADESGEHVDVDHDTEDCERREADGESFWDRIWSGRVT